VTGRRWAVAALVLALSVLAACTPLPPPRQGGPNRLVVEVLSSIEGVRAAIFIDAIDAKGSHGLNADTGRPYPADYSRTLPWEHTIAYGPGDVITMRVEAIIAGVPGDSLACNVTDRGKLIARAQPRPVDMVPTGATSAKVVCIYTTSGA